MGLVNLKQILADADEKKYAVGAFNIVCLESLQAVLDAAVAMKSPVILNVAEVHFKYVDLDEMAPIIRRAAEKAPVPVAIHLDHGESFSALVKAVRHGFTSVMFDGSTLEYEENVARTQEIVKIAHAAGVSVEAELGHVGGAEGQGHGAEADSSLYTDPEQALDFVRRTKVDALAVAIGSAHGFYKSQPKLDFERLDRIKKLVGVPLVLHGGSGISDEDFRKSISFGINKINFYSQMSKAATDKVKETIKNQPDIFNFPDLLLVARQAMAESVMERMQVFGSANVCSSKNNFCGTCASCSNALTVSAPTKCAGIADVMGMKKTSVIDVQDEQLVAIVTEVVKSVIGSVK